MARSILLMTGPVGIPASLVALAIGSLKDAHLDAEGACPAY
jgi:hypothetical protein